MCGFVGLAFARGADLEARLPAALDTLLHRGPDGRRVWADENVWLGHCRLAIIDLDSRSDQPMVDEETGNILVYNGEIYNYRELRTELESAGWRFRTQSDTEVLLKAYSHWGPAAFERMNGMWAVAIWEPRKRRLFVCRDRFGAKPLYYARLGNALAFASEPKALLSIAPGLAEPNPVAIAHLLVSSSSLGGGQTFFRELRSVPPASWAMIEEGGPIEFHRFWDYPEAEDGPFSSPQQQQEEFETLFESAVTLRLRSDVPVGLTLSGGLDSSAILAAMSGEGNQAVKAYTATYSGHFDEFEWAQAAARQAGADLTSVDSTSTAWLARLREIIWHMDAPGFSPAVFPLWNIMAKARADGVPVLLEGQGADELLGGYPQYAASHLLRQFLDGSPISAASALRPMARIFGFSHFGKWLVRLLIGPQYQSWQARAGRGSLLVEGMRDLDDQSGRGLGLDPFGMMQNDHSVALLPSLLHYGDAISMAHGIEARLPFLDYRLVEWVFRRRPNLFENGVTKSPVRNFLSGKGYSLHAKRLDKQGFPTPTKAWILDNNEWVMDSLIDDPNALLWQFINPKEARHLLTPHDYVSAFHGYKLISIQLWLENLREYRTTGLDQTPPAVRRAS